MDSNRKYVGIPSLRNSPMYRVALRTVIIECFTTSDTRLWNQILQLCPHWSAIQVAVRSMLYKRESMDTIAEIELVIWLLKIELRDWMNNTTKKEQAVPLLIISEFRCIIDMARGYML